MATRWRKQQARSKRSKRWTRRRLSTTRVLTRTRASDQAKQILALRSSINKIQNRFKPEIKKCGFSSTSFSLDSQLLSSSYQAYTATYPSLGSEDYQRIGDKIYA